MYEIFIDALADTAKMLPLLLVIYVVIELAEYKFGDKMREKIQKAGAAGPAVGALIGSFPQCGFSVVVAALYTQRLVTVGTLMAVYLATSDEAIPIILSQPGRAKIILPLILIKTFIALIAGYSLDFILRRKSKSTLRHIEACKRGEDDASHDHKAVLEKEACCGHSTSPSAKKFSFKEVFFHPIVHTAKIFVFIFVVSFLINAAVFSTDGEILRKVFLNHSFFQPFLAALIGLIPNCAASVAITEMYLEGIITYGSVVAGLCASGGLGLLVLFREEKRKKDAFKIIGLLFAISVAVGLVIQYFKI